MSNTTYRKKLIEVTLPLVSINDASAKEKGNPFLKGHPPQSASVVGPTSPGNMPRHTLCSPSSDFCPPRVSGCCFP